MDISKKLKSRYIKDYSLSIPILESPYFEYFLDLYEKIYTNPKVIFYK